MNSSLNDICRQETRFAFFVCSSCCRYFFLALIDAGSIHVTSHKLQVTFNSPAASYLPFSPLSHSLFVCLSSPPPPKKKKKKKKSKNKNRKEQNKNNNKNNNNKKQHQKPKQKKTNKKPHQQQQKKLNKTK